MIRTNDHDPVALHMQKLRSGQLAWEYILRGPEIFRIRIRRTSPPTEAEPPLSVPSTNVVGMRSAGKNLGQRDHLDSIGLLADRSAVLVSISALGPLCGNEPGFRLQAALACIHVPTVRSSSASSRPRVSGSNSTLSTITTYAATEKRAIARPRGITALK